MPRKRRDADESPQLRRADLALELAEELKSDRGSAQPLIDEQHFRTGAVRATVVWDKWDPVAPEDRAAIILRAYELAEGKEFRDRIALPIGLTVPEAHASGLLPVQILPALRPGDPVTLHQCYEAMKAEGASTLLEPDTPRLWFATEKDAEDARARLVGRLPQCEPVWLITRESPRVADLSAVDA